MGKASPTFRIGRVLGYLRGRVWYLCYFENGARRRPRVGANLAAARQMAAQVNAQLETGDLPLLSFDAVSVPDLRQRWLDHHEHVRRSSIATISRYRTATDHLVCFVRDVRPIKLASKFSTRDAEAFVLYLRTIEVAPNGHKHSAKRRLLDKGVKFILETCRALFNYAAKHRHLSAYAENPFSVIEVDRIPIENAKPILLLSPEEEVAFIRACDDGQFLVFATLMLTGMRPGELTHLLVDDVDFAGAVIHVRNKPRLGWQIKTRAERTIPILAPLSRVLAAAASNRVAGALFVQPRVREKMFVPGLAGLARPDLDEVAVQRLVQWRTQFRREPTRVEARRVARTIWRDLGAVDEDRIRWEFIRVCRRINKPHLTAPKLLRHGFATALQDANVDPLIRCQLMGHSTPSDRQAGGGLGMTAVYTHSRPETVRRQLEAAMLTRSVTPLIAQQAVERFGGVGRIDNVSHPVLAA